jgi:hypothetical protein
MGRKIEIQLLISPSMSEKKEEGTIRFSLRARSHFGFSDNCVSIGKGEAELCLSVKQAYKHDVKRIEKMLATKELPLKDAIRVGFVTQSVHRKLNEKKGSVWVTDGLENITIGCDPEFGLIDPTTKLLVRGDKVLPGSIQHKFGADGPGVEIRPDPLRDHIGVVENIRRSLENPPEGANKYKWVGGATYRDENRCYWFGGHVHLGRPASINAEIAGACYEKIAVALDHLVAFPMVSFDTPEPNKRRNGCQHQYGKAGDIRADYPEGNRFEYRVLSGLWLVHPTLARIVLGVSKCVAETAYGRIISNNKDPEYIQAPGYKKGLLRSFGLKGFREKTSIINNANPERLTEEFISEWEHQLMGLDRADEYKEELTALVEIVKSSPENVVPQLDLDIRNAWQNNKPLLPEASASLRKALDAVENKK